MKLKSKDIFGISVFIAGSVIACLTLNKLLGFQISISILLILMLVVFSVMALEMYRRLQRQIKTEAKAIKNDNLNHYKQSEALANVLNVIQLRSPLPSMRNFAVSPDLAKILIEIIQKKKPDTILETGSGVSTLLLGYMCKQNKKGKVYSLEDNEDIYRKTKEQIEIHDLNDYVNLILSPIKPVQLNGETWNWYDLEFLKQIDQINLLFVDGPFGKIQPLCRFPALPLLKDKLSKESVIVLDDLIREEEQKVLRLWKDKYPDIKESIFETEKRTAVLTL